MSRRLAVFASHPIQYQVPIWRALSASENLETVVHYFSDHSVRGAADCGFGVQVSWDVPLLGGYVSRFLQRDAQIAKATAVRIDDPRGLLRAGRFDAVLLQSYMHTFERQVAVSARRLGIRTVLRAELTDRPYRRGPLKTCLRAIYLRLFYRYIDAFCYIGGDARRHLERRNIAGGRLFFSPYAVDTALFDEQKKRFARPAARAKLGIADDDLVLLFSGKLIARKAPLLLAAAVDRMGDRTGLHVVVLGDGELRAAFEPRMRALLGERLHMPGFVNQSGLGLYYRAADVFVHPAEYETWGLVVNEAMQFGLPAIVSEGVGCRSDLIIPGRTGYTFPAGDVAALARHIETLQSDRELLRGMGVQAERHIAQYTTGAAARGILQAIGAA